MREDNFIPTARLALESDLPGILSILNTAIEETAAHWNLAPMTAREGKVWFRTRGGKGFPTLVVDGAEGVVGFATFDAFRPYQGFNRTVEHSIYVAPHAYRRGVGRALLREVIARAAELKMHALIAGIESGNEASLALHREEGFEVVGCLPQVGRKLDRWLDLVFMQRLLSE
ncbi:MAG: GNAT family N-acetyltransferase [Methyloligella sp. ZOD6]